MIFKSAVDGWYYVVIVAVAIVVLFSIVPPIRSGHLSVTLGGAIVILSLGLPLWLLFSTSYRVDTQSLFVKSGPFSWTIPLAEIQSVEPSRSLISSPTLSLERLEIRYGNGKSVLVSPADRESFLETVNRHKAAN
jgi:membrane protein YdbS with pleckstrin-like domain